MRDEYKFVFVDLDMEREITIRQPQAQNTISD
jgi:hypothetical protein